MLSEKTKKNTDERKNWKGLLYSFMCPGVYNGFESNVAYEPHKTKLEIGYLVKTKQLKFFYNDVLRAMTWVFYFSYKC